MVRVAIPLLLLLVTSDLTAARSSYGVQFYKNCDSGEQYDLFITYGKCYNMSAALDNNVGSIYSRGICLEVFDKRDCKGRATRVVPGIGDHSCNSSVTTSSFRICVPKPGEKHSLELYSECNFNGKEYPVTVEDGSCHTIDTDKHDFTVKSLDNLDSACFRFFKGRNCTGRSYYIAPTYRYDECLERPHKLASLRDCFR